MRRIDPTFIVILVIGFALASMFDVPLIVFGVIAYFIYRARRRRTLSDTSSRERRYAERDRRYQRPSSRREEQRTRAPKPTSRVSRKNPFKESGIKKFKDFDYEGAIEDFEKALAVSDTDASVHFNLACAYSLTEKKEKSFYHLSKAVENGFTDFEKIKGHDALAYLRVQDEFDDFVAGGYKYRSTPIASAVEKSINKDDSLLEQLRQLAQLREKGLLTAEEFETQKRRLMG